MAESPSITVVVATRNRPAQLASCLQCLQHQRFRDFAVLVVDSAPSPDDFTARDIAEQHGFGYVRVKKRGSSRARNEGARAAKSAIIAFTDDDALPAEDWLEHIHSAMQRRDVSAVVGRTLPVKVETEAERLYDSWGGFPNAGTKKLAIDCESEDWLELTAFKGMGMLANMAIRAGLFHLKSDYSWHGFDRRLGRGTVIHGYDENHALFRIVYDGHFVMYDPEMVVRHPYLETMDELRTEHLLNISAASAFSMLIYYEHPIYQRRLRLRTANKLGGQERAHEIYAALGISKWDLMRARLRGTLWYLRSLFVAR